MLIGESEEDFVAEDVCPAWTPMRRVEETKIDGREGGGG